MEYYYNKMRIQELKNHNLKPKTYKLKPDSGFSYVEILIVMTLIVITSLGGTVSLIGFYRSQQPLAAMRSMGAAVRDAAQRSIAQEDGRYWGVQFDNLIGRDRYVVFSALTTALGGYATSSVTYFARNVQFTEPTISSVVLFDKMTGAWVSSVCPLLTASTTITANGNSLRIYCNGKIE